MVSFADFSPLIKLVLSFDMLVGRLEIFPMLVLFAPSTWLRSKAIWTAACAPATCSEPYKIISICAPCCICLEQNSAAGGVCVCAGKPTMTGSSACL